MGILSVTTHDKKGTKCQQVKPIDDFGKNRRTSDGRHYWCRDCVRNYMHSGRGRTAVRRAVTRKLREGYYRFGRGAIPILRQGAEKRGVPFNLTADQLESWWKRTPDVCEYCGCTILEFRQLRDAVLSYRGDNSDLINFKRAFGTSRQAKIDWKTIDRRSNGLGYVLGNLAKACWFCNYVKGTLLTHDDMRIIGPRVLARLREGLAAASG